MGSNCNPIEVLTFSVVSLTSTVCEGSTLILTLLESYFFNDRVKVDTSTKHIYSLKLLEQLFKQGKESIVLKNE